MKPTNTRVASTMAAAKIAVMSGVFAGATTRPSPAIHATTIAFTATSGR
ncbi:Uncharacterised protein [Collinsella intestinalis]|nr:Uncharacterised protein [Collinsella intestinalis]